MDSKKISQLPLSETLNDEDLLVISKKQFGNSYSTYNIKALKLKPNYQDLSKVIIESKLTGLISSHYHDWNDIINKPNDYNVIINQNGVLKGSFTFNQLSNTVINLDGISLGETSTTAYRGDRGKIAYDHSQSTHAPNNAQKNSDITKPEIESKLTGIITTHTHDYNDLSNKPSLIDTLLSGIENLSVSGNIVETDTVIKAIRKLRDQISLLTRPVDIGAPADVGGEGYYPFAQSDGTLYTSSQTIVLQPGYYRFVCANMFEKDVFARRIETGEYLAGCSHLGNQVYKTSAPDTILLYSNTWLAGAGQNNAQGIGYYSNGKEGAETGTLVNSDKFLKYLFSGLPNITKVYKQDGIAQISVGNITVSHIVNIVEPTSIYLQIPITYASNFFTGNYNYTDTDGMSLIWIREVGEE